jgi:membrane associated rhomboid family serine protease
MGLLVMLGRVQGKDVPVGIAASIRQYAISYSIFVIVISFFVPNVNNWVHAGGFLAGALVGLVVGPVEAVGGRRLRLVERGVLVVVIAVAVVALGLGIHHTADILIQPAGDVPGVG